MYLRSSSLPVPHTCFRVIWVTTQTFSTDSDLLKKIFPWITSPKDIIAFCTPLRVSSILYIPGVEMPRTDSSEKSWRHLLYFMDPWQDACTQAAQSSIWLVGSIYLIYWPLRSLLALLLSKVVPIKYFIFGYYPLHWISFGSLYILVDLWTVLYWLLCQQWCF